MSEPRPIRRRRGRGARERILAAATDLFTTQGINATGMEQLSTAANVSKRTLYVHFPSKDALVEAYLRQFDAAPLPTEAVLYDVRRPARERLLALFDVPADASVPVWRGCVFLNAAVEVPDPSHAVHALAADHKRAFARQIADLAREAGATEPEVLGEQLALLYDGGAARSMALNNVQAAASAARGIAIMLVDAAIPVGANAGGRAEQT
jgi:AcrR family transcriptional regulator